MKHVLFVILILISCKFFPKKLHAQSCTPYTIYKDDFGGDASSPAVGPALPNGVTTYEYTTGIPEDSWYSIKKQVEGHKGTWHPIKDHTGDGYMMVVNADYDPGLFYQKTITDLCQGTSFKFSVWVANLMKLGAAGDKDPDLRFVIRNPNNNEIIGEKTTGLLPRFRDPTWEEYGINFDLPPGLSSVILQIFNNADGGGGNDLVLDDITFSICGPDVAYTVTGMYDGGSNVCVGEKVNLKADFPNGSYHNPEFQWQFSTDKQQWTTLSGEEDKALSFNGIQSSDSGWYRILAAEQGNIHKEKCRISSNPEPIKVWTAPQTKITSNDPLCEGDKLQLGISSNTTLTAEWVGPNQFTADQLTMDIPNIKINQAGTYHVKVTNPGGCTANVDKEVHIQENILSTNFVSVDPVLCQNEQRLLDAENPGATYLWNTGASDPAISIHQGGKYIVNIREGLCTLTDSIEISEVKNPKVSLGKDTTICMGEPFTLMPTGENIAHYQWDDGSTEAFQKISQAGTYGVTVTNQCGTASDFVHIDLEECSDHLLFPTAFSPNEDGQNDVFRPRIVVGVKNYHLEIYNRWGEKVFQSKNPKDGWKGTIHGKAATMGAYVWQVSYRRTKNNQFIQQKGAIMLVR